MKNRDFIAIIRKLYVWVKAQRIIPHTVQRMAHLKLQAHSFQQSIQHFHFTCKNHIRDAYSDAAARHCPLNYTVIPVISFQKHREHYRFQINKYHRGNHGHAVSHEYFKATNKRYL